MTLTPTAQFTCGISLACAFTNGVSPVLASGLPETRAWLRDSNGPTVIYGESQVSRTIYTAVSLVCVSCLTGMLGYRARQLKWSDLRTLNFTRVLVLVLFLLAISFVTSAAIVESGLGLSTLSICHAAIITCLVFYTGSKATMYLFLVERAHALRAPYVRRSHDWIWLVGMITIAAGFGSIAICGFLWPLADLSHRDGRCRIGLPIKVTVPLLSFDVFINTALTGVFIYLLRPLLRFGGLTDHENPESWLVKRVRRILKPKDRRGGVDMFPINQNFLKSIEALLWKSLIASVLVMLPTVGNLAALYTQQGKELGWLCLTICTFDVTWAAGIIHWLTIGSTEVDERALAIYVQGDSSTNVSTGPTYSL